MWEIITEIIPNRLYLTGYKGASNVKQVLDLKIDIIVSATDFIAFKYNKPIQFSNIKFVHFYAEDSPGFDIEQHFEPFCKLMNDNPNKKILVHCLIGASRSATLVMAYLLKTQNENTEFSVILKNLQEKRVCVDPNDGFIHQLKEYEQNIKDNKLLKITKKTK